MTRSAANGLILQDLFIYKAPTGTTGPTNTTTALAAGWLDCGWVDQDGMTMTPQGSTTELKGVTGATLAYIKDGDGFEYSFNLIESNKITDSLLYPGGTPVTSTGITTNTVKAQTAPSQQAFVLEEHYSNGSIRRVYVPLAVAICGAVASKYTDYRKYPVTISAIQASDKTLHIDITDNTSETVP